MRTNACIRPQSRKLLRCKFPKIDNLQRARCARCASCQCRLILSVFYVLYELYIALCVSFAVLWKLHQVLRVCGFEALRIRKSLPSTLRVFHVSHLSPAAARLAGHALNLTSRLGRADVEAFVHNFSVSLSIHKPRSG